MAHEECDLAAGWLMDGAYGELPPDEAERLAGHLAVCPRCARLQSDLGRLAGVRGATIGSQLEEMLPGEVRARAGQMAVQHLLERWLARIVTWVVAALLAALSCKAIQSRPALAAQSVLISLATFLAWASLYGTTLEGLVTGWTQRPRRVTSGLRSRAVAYGVLASVGLSIMILGAALAWDVQVHRWWTRNLSAHVSELVALLSSGSLLLVGLAMGFSLGREWSLNMLCVLVIYVAIMFPALARGGASLLRPDDLLFGLCLVLAWGLSGAYVGNFLSQCTRRAMA